jgi:hypothetical protein
VTSRGGRHLGHTLVRGRDRTSRVADTVKYWRDTCPGHGGHTHDAILTTVVVVPQNHLALRMTGFTEFGPQNSMTAVVSDGSGGGTTKGASRRSNFLWSARPLDKKPRSWSILPLAEWIDSI